MGQGPLGPRKLHFVAKVQILAISDRDPLGHPKTGLGCKSSILAISDRSGPVEHRRFFKAALHSPNVEKCDQNGSAW